jgi:hypothetical protein
MFIEIQHLVDKGFLGATNFAAEMVLRQPQLTFPDSL